MAWLSSVVTTGESRRAGGASQGPARTCVGCRQVVRRGEAVRFVLGPEGELVADVAGKSFGRGAWVHPTESCLRGATAGGLARSFRAPVRTTVEQLAQAIALAADRQMYGLIVAARNTRQLTFGADATREAWQAGQLGCILVARDAGTIATRHWVMECIAAGRAVAWGTKSELSTLLARGETAVVGVRGDQFSEAIRQAASLVVLAGPATGAVAPARVEV